MSVQQIILKHPILHIRPESSSPADNIDAALTASGILADTCADVYRATARICSAPEDSLRVLIVSLDGFSREEMEFFALMRRIQPSLMVFVHASSASNELVEDSIALGASGLVTQDSVAGAVSNVADAVAEIQHPADHEPPEEASAAHEFTRSAGKQPVTPPDISFDEDDEDDNRMRLQPDRPVEAGNPVQAEYPLQAQRPVQVPWLRRPNPPLRVAPTSADAPDSAAPPRRPPAAGAYAHEPLLSEDELRALMDEEPCDGSSDHPAEDDPHHTNGPEDEA